LVCVCQICLLLLSWTRIVLWGEIKLKEGIPKFLISRNQLFGDRDKFYKGGRL
jgi:hypothetical protein